MKKGLQGAGVVLMLLGALLAARLLSGVMDAKKTESIVLYEGTPSHVSDVPMSSDYPLITVVFPGPNGNAQGSRSYSVPAKFCRAKVGAPCTIRSTPDGELSAR